MGIGHKQSFRDKDEIAEERHVRCYYAAERMDELKARLRQSQEELIQKSKEAERLQVVAEETRAEAAEVLETLTQSTQENLEMKSELTLLWMVDRLRSEHQLLLAAEQKRMDSLVQDKLLRRIADLEKASAVAGRTTRNDDLLPADGVSDFDDQLLDRSRWLSDGGGTGTEAPLVSESSSSTGTSIVSSAAFSTCGTSLGVVSGSGISAAVVSCAGACVPSLSGMSMTMNKRAGVTTEVPSPVFMPRLVDDGYPLPVCSTRVGARSLTSGLSPATVEFVPTLVSHTTCSTLSEPGYRTVLSLCLVPGSSAAGMVSVPSGMAGVITGVDGVGFSHDSSFTGLMTGPSRMTGMTASLSTDRVFCDSSSVAGLVNTPSGMTGLTAGIGKLIPILQWLGLWLDPVV